MLHSLAGRHASSRVLSTLDPRYLLPSDLVDLSGRIKARITLSERPQHEQSTSPAVLLYGPVSSPPYRALPFPPNTRGFLYWDRRLDISRSGLAGALKFRLIHGNEPSDPAHAFAFGHDLLLPGADRRVWARVLPAIATRVQYRGITSDLLRSGVVSSDDLQLCRQAFPPRTALSTRLRLLYRLGQSFLLDIHSPKLHLRAVSPRQRVVFPAVQINLYQGFGKMDWPACFVRAHFERVQGDSSSSSQLLMGLRIDSVLTPYNVAAHPGVLFAPPVAGELLQVRDGGTLRPWVVYTERYRGGFEALLQEENAHWLADNVR